MRMFLNILYFLCKCVVGVVGIKEYYNYIIDTFIGGYCIRWEV